MGIMASILNLFKLENTKEAEQEKPLCEQCQSQEGVEKTIEDQNTLEPKQDIPQSPEGEAETNEILAVKNVSESESIFVENIASGNVPKTDIMSDAENKEIPEEQAEEITANKNDEEKIIGLRPKSDSEIEHEPETDLSPDNNTDCYESEEEIFIPPKSMPGIDFPIFIGEIDEWEEFFVDLAEVYHILIFGMTGCGKTTLLHNIISRLIDFTSPKDIQMVICDEAGVEFYIYIGIPHLFLPVISSAIKIDGILNWCVAEIKDRMSKIAAYGTRNIKSYNEKISHYSCAEKPSKLPHFLLILDGAYNPQNIESLLYILQNGRAAGVHLILSTSNDKNISKLYSHFTATILFRTFTSIKGNLVKNYEYNSLGIGEAYYTNILQKQKEKISIPDIDYEKIRQKIDEIKTSRPSHSAPEYDDVYDIISPFIHTSYGEADSDALFAEAGKFIIEKDKASVGMLQRVFKIGFNRAARIMDQLCDAGVVGPEEGVRPRKILMSAEEFENYLEQNI